MTNTAKQKKKEQILHLKGLKNNAMSRSRKTCVRVMLASLESSLSLLVCIHLQIEMELVREPKREARKGNIKEKRIILLPILQAYWRIFFTSTCELPLEISSVYLLCP